MTKVHIPLLGFILVVSVYYQPNWVYENFWGKADFHSSLSFTMSYMHFLAIYAVISTALTELGIRLIKKYV